MNFDIRTDKPEVSVSVITYNNGPYIRECLDSILDQETDFSYEICLGEDGSTDGTREICIEYAERHPEKIRLFLRTQEDAGRERFKSQGVYNYIETTRECCGTYVAFCDGDDAWICKKKLQKQVDLLAADPGVSLVHSDFDKSNEVTGKQIHGFNSKRGIKPCVKQEKEKAIIDLLLCRYAIAASSVVARTSDVLDIFDSSEELFLTYPMGDTQTWCELLRRGRFHYMDEALALYRITKESTSNSLSALKKFEFVNDTADLGLRLISRYNLPNRELMAYKVKNSNRYAMLSGDIHELEKLHASHSNAFEGVEKLLFRINRSALFRPVVAVLFQMRYIRNHLRL
ncbi:glycosyltransferase [Pontiella agarivorans]|uniref:Glycosyltransferase n=1 Tax=Pontiella agarivorans TaxID=3038953 RepID=A0ABU5MU71_9BACT|nr:glycosyltransferase [Pontiella agarivorans]MDZ8117762.1 glycosyltransferase [Pontiella agarivorans]